ncbi:MAG: prepilin-type N-terminal cleavage/methylation domain-containing protein [Phycisphaerae bacterium]|nr:prepilin-type N-terminal cleavage/methylation domain-containing protein [Phycisphaerae bacterium]
MAVVGIATERNMMDYLKNKPRAFTLIELLVVIAIIALLLAIIMPSLAMAKRHGKAVFCMNNLRQMSLASSSYTMENKDYYPLAHYNIMTDGILYVYSWDFTSHKDWSTTPAENIIEPGILWQGQTLEQVQQCPSFKGDANWFADPFTGYNYNTSYIGRDETVFPAKSARASEVRSPGATALFGDGQYAEGANKFMRPPLPAAGGRDASVADAMRAAGTQGYRHNNKTNVAFCDGHVESWKELSTSVTDLSVKNGLDEYNQTHDIKIGFLSDDNKVYDLK